MYVMLVDVNAELHIRFKNGVTDISLNQRKERLYLFFRNLKNV